MNLEEIENSLNERAYFEELAFHISEYNFKEIKTLIPKYLENKYWLQKMICFLTNFSGYNYKLIGDLFSLTGNSELKMDKYSQFPRYLFLRGLITEKDFDSDGIPEKEKLGTIEEYEKPFKEDTLEYYIFKDDLQSFVSHIITNEIDLNQEYEIQFNDVSFSKIIEFAFHKGSLNILKYLIINNIEITDNSINYSFNNGSKEIIGLLIQLGYSFDGYYLINAIARHNNNIAKWLFENYEPNADPLSCCVPFFNTEMLLYFLNEQKLDIDTVDVDHQTCLHWSVMENDLLVTKYLLLMGIDQDVKNCYNLKAIDEAMSKEMKDIFEQF